MISTISHFNAYKDRECRMGGAPQPPPPPPHLWGPLGPPPPPPPHPLGEQVAPPPPPPPDQQNDHSRYGVSNI